MTSLAKQLERLAVPHTRAVYGEDKRRKSLLFDPREAAALDKEAVFAIGTNGIAELQAIDPVFDEFQEILFGESTMSFQRSIQTAEVNAQIDETIESFLQKLSPYCLLKPAQKALEWLIYRFDIDVYNIDAFMVCLLPFHESKIFIRAVQLLKLKSKTATKWDWLLPIQSSGVHLPRQTLINHCNSNIGFLSFLCDKIYKTIKGTLKRDEEDKFRVIFSFYMSTVVGVLEFGGATENLVSSLLPHLSRGLKSKVAQYRAATYMILGQLVFKSSLQQDLLKSLLSALFKRSILKLERETMTCAALIFQHQKIKSLPARSFKHICRQPGLIETLKTLTTEGCCDGLALAFLERLVVMAVQQDSDMSASESSDSEAIWSTPQYLSILHDFLSSVPLSEGVADQLTKEVMENYLLSANNIIDDEGVEELSNKHKKTVQLLEDRYPASLDRAVQDLLEGEEDERVKKMIQDFLNLSVLSLRHQHLSDMDGTLSLSINHRTPSVRVGAVQYLLKNMDKCDSEYVSEVLSARLADDSLEVVDAVLEAGQSLWSMLSDNTRLCQLLCNIVLRCRPWSDIGSKALQVLCSCDPNLHSSVILHLFPRLLLCTSDDLDFLKDLCDTVLAKSNPMIKSIAQKLKKKSVGKKKQSAEDVAELSIEVTEWLASAVIKMPDCEDFLSELEGRGDSARYKCHQALFLNAIIPLMSEQKNQIQWCGKQLKLLHQLRPQGQPMVDWEEVITMVTDTCQSLVANQTQGNSISLYLLSNLIKLLPSIKIDAEFWDFDDDALILSVRLFDYLLLLSNTSPCRQAYRKLVIQFLQHFPDSNDKLKFLGLLWTQHCNDLSERSGVKTSLQIQALLIGKQLLQQSENMKITDTVIVNLVLALTSPFVGIRQTSMECLKFLTGKGNLGRGALTPLVNHILQCEVEIDADQGYLRQAVSSVLDSEPRKSKRRSHSGKVDSSLRCVIVDVIQNPDTPHYIRNSLLQITALHNNKSFLCDLLPTLRSLLSTCHGDSPPALAVESCGCLIQRFTPDTCSTLDSHPAALNLVLEMLASPVKEIQENMISQVTGDFYNKLSPETQQQILSCLFDVWVKAPGPGTVKVIRKTLKHLTLESSHVVEELNKCLQTSPSALTVKERKKHRKSDVHKEEEDIFEQLPWQRVVVVMETIQSKKKISNYLQLLPTLFKILSEVLNSDQHSSAEYIKQLLLSVVDEVCQKAVNHDLIPDLKKETSFNIDLIVNAIRTSSNPQTHHKALLLLTTASKIFPEDLLHKVMSVFTFMGANIMRHDDQYSFHVINRILETVVPALVTACEKREAHTGGQSKEEVITMVMQVFVDAYCHIPEHRRLMLFTRLVEIVGGDNFLWRCVLLKMTQEITRPTIEKVEEEDSEVQFDLNLLSQFSITIQINSIAAMINYVSELPVDKPTETTKRRKSGKHSLEKVGIFQVETHTAKQLRHFKFRTVKLLLSWCVSPTLVHQLSACEEGEITSGFHHLIQTILTYICSLMELKSEDQTLAKFYRALTHKMYDLLDKVVGLLPEKMLLRVIKELMDHSIPNIQRKSMELLNNFLLQKEHSEDLSLLGVVDKLLKVCVSEKTEMTTKQTALYSLKLLCRRIGADHPQMFIKVLSMAVEIFCCEGVNQSLQASALLCISEVCSTLKAHVIAHLSTFMPKIISCLKDRQLLDGNELFLLSIITAVLRVMENLCLFLSPYLQDIVTQICSLSGHQTEVLQKASIQQKLKAIRTTIATSLPPRVLLGILPDCYDRLLTVNPKGIQPMMALLTDHVSHMKKEDLNSHLVQLQGFYLTCLDVQAQYQGEVEDTEDSVIDAIVATVMKLSEATFRPMFYKMFDWATREEELKHRILVFYKMADRLAGKMQSLFTIFAGHIIVHAAQILKDNNKEMTGEDYFDSSKLGKHKAHKLLVYICDCLYKCFLYDTEGFVTKERFDTLLQALVDQLENVDDEPLSKERVSEHLVPCLVQFGAATQDDSLWKTLNYQILLKTRHSSSAVRYAALIAVDEFHKKLSEDYMPLLPETIPFLAELMEDEEEEVEKMCQSVISQMEKTLGEPLQKYF
ncbi:HEAT repeat-containing protein 1-like [Saccostrea cucullata]|uniref:HEAT repeat-containing protein 1-like n=1 Tax=Saccostrea cuccullata TaxID=36930 RepID=UPI002ED2369B